MTVSPGAAVFQEEQYPWEHPPGLLRTLIPVFLIGKSHLPGELRFFTSYVFQMNFINKFHFEYLTILLV